jgi:hypothetical protein
MSVKPTEANQMHRDDDGKSVMEKITGESDAQLLDHEWPSKDDLKDYTWPSGVEPRGSVRLAAGLVIGRTEIAIRWQEAKEELLKLT